jgi:lantibiotic modifying enzyme
LTVLAGRGHELAKTVLPHSTSRMLGALDTYGPRCGTPDGVLSPGLLTGLSGIGYGLLRLGFPEIVPSILLLEPTREHNHKKGSST